MVIDSGTSHPVAILNRCRPRYWCRIDKRAVADLLGHKLEFLGLNDNMRDGIFLASRVVYRYPVEREQAIMDPPAIQLIRTPAPILIYLITQGIPRGEIRVLRIIFCNGIECQFKYLSFHIRLCYNSDAWSLSH